MEAFLMELDTKQVKRVGLHLLFWTVILFWRANGDYFTKIPFEKFVWHNLLRLPFTMLTTYTLIYYLIPEYIIKKKQYIKFMLLFGLILFLATMGEKWIIVSDVMRMVLEPIDEKPYNWMTQLHPYRNSFLMFAIAGVVSLIHFFKLYTEQEKRKNELIQENLETQYAFLKAQVNPHFLFNALNNIYSMAVQAEQKEIAQGLEDLSGIMHYLTYESSTKKVLLEKEIRLLQNYIAIEQLRFDDTDDTTISFNVEGDFSQKLIAPVVLLPLVENAFKHGIKPDRTCLVSIKLLVENDSLQCKIKNTVFDFENKEIKGHGIGLENVRKRLDLQYTNLYTLASKRVDHYYITDLTISLEEKVEARE